MRKTSIDRGLPKKYNFSVGWELMPIENFLTEVQFNKFRDHIYNASGIHFSSSNRTILESRLKERLRKSGTTDIEEYYTQITTNEGEMKTLLDTVTTNLTRFFRNTAHFKAFEHHVIPELVKYKKTAGTDKTIRIWSAGCSTGEEPYSLAMVLKDILPTDFKFDITASDLSLKCLMTAKEGFYSEQKVNGVSEKYLQRYFEKKPNGYLVKEDIRNSVKFDYHNLKSDSGQRNLDMIFCRNVIIYFDEMAQNNVINKFYQSMNNHAYLFIGHSESLFGMDTKFEFLKTEWATMYRKFTN
jgi:chemotaxis protein methyltransferase CheR